MKKSTLFGGASGANVVEKRYEGLDVDKEGKYVLALKKINNTALVTYKNNLQLIHNLCKNNEIQVYSILQPTLFSKHKQEVSDKLKRAKQIALAYHAFDYQEHVDTFQKLYDANKEVFGEENIVDATVMNGKEQLFFDHIHQSPYGTDALGKLVYDKVVVKLNEP